MEFLGLIPARGGSKGLPGKNIKLLGDKPLIAHTIEAAKKSKKLDRIIVVTDSEDIASVARDYGAETPFMRPAEISGGKSHAFAVYKYAAEWLRDNEGYIPDIVCNMLCTTVFRSHVEIDECMELMEKTNCDWCFTVNEIEHHPYRAMVREEKTGKIKAFHDVPRELMWANRQELPIMHRFNGGVIACKTEHLFNNTEYNIGSDFKTDVRSVVMSQELAVDIDNLTDFMLAEAVLRKMELSQ